MIELHGWLTIHETYDDEDLCSQEMLDCVRYKVKTILSESGIDTEIKYVNGVPFLNTLICANHRTKEIDNIIEMYKNIAQIATGSYGIIYLRDDEDSEHSNEFQIYLFMRGNYIYKSDNYFSPCIPTIEGKTCM